MNKIWKTLSPLLITTLVSTCSVAVPGLFPAQTPTATLLPTLVPLKDVTVIPIPIRRD